jgi:choline dehydrogenase-like flavoprotein
MSTTATEVLIVGAGLSGAVAALGLSRTGIKVTCLEQGEWTDPGAYPGDKADFELQAMGPWHANPNQRKADADYPILDDSSEIKPMLYNGVGGSTILYSAHWMRFQPGDFRVKSLDGVADDWPISYRDLAPYYDLNDQEFGVSGIAGDPAYPDHPEYPLPPLPIQTWGEKVAHAHHRLGWHWWPGSNAIASQPYRNRRPCVQRSTCRAGCNEGAKASVDRSHWPEALANGVELITGARVSRILLDDKGLACAALYRDTDGNTHRIDANLVLLASHAIGSTRLLLNSANSQFPDGLANRSGQVGRNLMMHPLCRIIGFFDEPMMSWQGHWGQSIYSMEFSETRPEHDFVRGAKWNLGPSGGPLAAALYPLDEARCWGDPLHNRIHKWLGRSAVWGITAEDLPKPHNRLVLDPDKLDADGDPTIRIRYRVSKNSRRMLDFMASRAIESFQEAGAYETSARRLVTENGWHALGTCRMGSDPKTSVVDPWMRSHDIENLYIIDGSVFVTASSVNPAATIAALARRCADHLVKTRYNARVANS